MENSSVARALPAVKAAYSFLRDEVSASFHLSGWNKGRIVCHQSQLKGLLPSVPNQSSGKSLKSFVPIANSNFPLPGTRIHTEELDSDEHSLSEEATDSETETELMAATV